MLFIMEVVQKLKFPNNPIAYLAAPISRAR